MYMSRYSLFRSFLSSPLGDQVRVLLAAVLLVSTSVGFALGSFSRIRQGLLWLSSRLSPIVPGTPTAERVVSAVEAADRPLPGHRTCLMRSLTAETLLQLYAFTPEHRIGVTTETTDGMKAHSWLELHDTVLIGDLEDLSRYEPLPSLRMWEDL